jgi:hypothetical protein
LDSFFERASLDSHEWAERRVDRVVLINVVEDPQDACRSIDIKISNLDGSDNALGSASKKVITREY